MQSTQSLSRALRRAPAHSGALRRPSALPEHQPVLSALPGRRPALSITAPPRRQPTSSAFLGISRASARLFRTHQRRPIFSAPTSDGPSSPGPQRFPDVGPPSRPHRFPSVAPSFPRPSALPERRPRPSQACRITTARNCHFFVSILPKRSIRRRYGDHPRVFSASRAAFRAHFSPHCLRNSPKRYYIEEKFRKDDRSKVMAATPSPRTSAPPIRAASASRVQPPSTLAISPTLSIRTTPASQVQPFDNSSYWDRIGFASLFHQSRVGLADIAARKRVAARSGGDSLTRRTRRRGRAARARV